MYGTCDMCYREKCELECYYNNSTGEEVWACCDCDPNEKEITNEFANTNN